MLLALSLVLVSALDGQIVLKGLDPVELARGREVAGDPERAIDRDGLRYLFSSDQSREAFVADPERFEIQFGGSCARMGPMSGRCSMDRFAVHDGRIYVFASDDCRKGFLASPELHLDVAEPALSADEAATARGLQLVDLALAGLGGAAKVDSVVALKLERSGPKESGGMTYATRDTILYRFPDGIRTEAAWDDWVYTRVLTGSDAFQGSSSFETIAPTGVAESRRQLAREPLWILRHRSAEGFQAMAAGTVEIDDVEAQILRVREHGSVTDLAVDPTSGRILRASWTGRLDSGVRGEIVVEFSDFRDVAGVNLPHARETRFDGTISADHSGPFTVVEIDPAIAPEAFERRG